MGLVKNLWPGHLLIIIISVDRVHRNPYPLLRCIVQRGTWTVGFSRDSSQHRSRSDPTVHVMCSAVLRSRGTGLEFIDRLQCCTIFLFKKDLTLIKKNEKNCASLEMFNTVTRINLFFFCPFCLADRIYKEPIQPLIL
jgi:hypothetical protein